RGGGRGDATDVDGVAVQRVFARASIARRGLVDDDGRCGAGGGPGGWWPAGAALRLARRLRSPSVLLVRCASAGAPGAARDAAARRALRRGRIAPPRRRSRW